MINEILDDIESLLRLLCGIVLLGAGIKTHDSTLILTSVIILLYNDYDSKRKKEQ